jgi:hypothetical protein
MALCDFDTRVTIYKGYGNPISIVPYSDIRNDTAIDMTGVTKVRVCVGGVTAESDDVPAYVWWDGAVGNWVIHFKPGLFPLVPTGEQDAMISVFSPDYPNGLVLTHTFPLNILEIC